MFNRKEFMLKKDVKKSPYRRDIGKGFCITYLVVLVEILLLVIYLLSKEDCFSLTELAEGLVGNLIGILVTFLTFNIVNTKLTKDSYASEISKQILDTLRYNPKVFELYEDDQKKEFVNELIGSIVRDKDVAEMINNHLNSYLFTERDYKEKVGISEKDCRIRTAYSYRFVLETERTLAFNDLKASRDGEGGDPYFYVQEELNYKVKYLAPKGNYTNNKEVKIGFVYDNAVLDRFLRGNKGERNNVMSKNSFFRESLDIEEVDKEMSNHMRNCLFRESLDIEDVDKEMFNQMSNGNKNELIALVKKMFRPHLKIDRCKGEIVDVEVVRDRGIFITFKINHDTNAMEHAIDIVFHIPKKWNTVVEVALVEPTKSPYISLSYNEDIMDVEMYTFLNKGETSAYENTSENENGIYSIALTEDWIFPISGVTFSVGRKM